MNSSTIALGTYNPSQVPKQTLLAEFTARQDLLTDLLGILLSNEVNHPCQHSLLIGPRGFGKTTTLLALKYRVEDDPRFTQQWLPLLFDEENYHIADLTGFWLECLRLAETSLSATVPRRYTELNRSRDPNLESIARDAFLATLEGRNKRGLLLIDNLNDILAVVNDPDEQHRLRALLQDDSRLCIVGTACTYFNAIEHVDQPFYNLFRLFRLDRFTKDELRAALEAMWKSRATAEGAPPLPDSDGYWRGLHILTGGNPRLMKMIFQLFEQGVTPDFRSQLEGLLDAYTPYFKHRIESMSPQQRRVFDAIAMAWDPVHLSDIAPELRMESNKISAQVGSLIDAQLVAIAGGSEKRRTYQIADRFSNIHYFMRFSRAGHSKFEWFIRTMKVLLSPDEYCMQLDRMRGYGLACGTDAELRDQIQLLAGAIYALDDASVRRAEGQKSVAAFLSSEQESALAHLISDPATREALGGEEHAVVEFLARLPKDAKNQIGYEPKNAEWWYRFTDFAEEASLWDIAEVAYRRVIELDPSFAFAWYSLGDLLSGHLGRYKEAEVAYRKAIKLDPDFAFFWGGLGHLLMRDPECYAEAEAAYRKAIKLAPDFGLFWSSLGFLLSLMPGRCEEAEAAYRKAIKLSPGFSFAWSGLGNLLQNHFGRYKEAEAAYRKAVKLDPGSGYPKALLADLLERIDPASLEARTLATEAVIASPETDLARLVFYKLALHDLHAAASGAEALANGIALESFERIEKQQDQRLLKRHSLALNCLKTLIISGASDVANGIIERTGTQEIFDIPLQAIKLLADPKHRGKLAEERLALVEAFLEPKSKGLMPN